jgi:hypothetical protein
MREIEGEREVKQDKIWILELRRSPIMNAKMRSTLSCGDRLRIYR